MQLSRPVKVTKQMVDETTAFDNSEDFLRSGGFSIEALERAAYGFSSDDIKEIDPKDIRIKWTDDLTNVKIEIRKSGKTPVQWSETVDLTEPVEISYSKGRFYLEDGHHRYYAARLLGKKLNCTLDITEAPLNKLAPDMSYDEYTRAAFDTCKGLVTESLYDFELHFYTSIAPWLRNATDEPQEDNRPIISYDFDGVLHTSVDGLDPISFIDWEEWEVNTRMHKQMMLDAVDNKIVVTTARPPSTNDFVWAFIEANDLPVEIVYCTNDFPKPPVLQKIGAIKHYDDNKSLGPKLADIGIEFEYVDPSINESVQFQNAPNIDDFFIATSGVFKEIDNIPQDYKKFFVSRNSRYYTNDDKTILVRRSNHWGSGIKNCDWYLDGYERVDCSKWTSIYGPLYRFGEIKFDELQHKSTNEFKVVGDLDNAGDIKSLYLIFYKGEMHLINFGDKEFIQKTKDLAAKLDLWIEEDLFGFDDACDWIEKDLSHDLPGVIVAMINPPAYGKDDTGEDTLEIFSGQYFDPFMSPEMKKIIKNFTSVTRFKYDGKMYPVSELKLEYPDTVYHGTTLKNSWSIMRTGIRPRPHNSNFDLKHDRYVFMTTAFETARRYSLIASGRKYFSEADNKDNRNVILEIDATKLDRAKMVLDFDFYAQYVTKGMPEYDNISDWIGKQGPVKSDGITMSTRPISSTTGKEHRFKKFGYGGTVMPAWIKALHVKVDDEFVKMTPQEYKEFLIREDEEQSMARHREYLSGLN